MQNQIEVWAVRRGGYYSDDMATVKAEPQRPIRDAEVTLYGIATGAVLGPQRTDENGYTRFDTEGIDDRWNAHITAEGCLPTISEVQTNG